MAISGHLNTWQNKKVLDWKLGTAVPLTGEYFYRLGSDWEDTDTWTDRFALFLAQPGVTEVTGLIIGFWNEEKCRLDSVVEAIVGARERLPKLTALFVGDIPYDEWEISWIAQTDLSPLLTAYGELEHFAVRGAAGLSLGIPRLPRLKSLTIESGGLPVSVIEEVSAAELPALEHLELYLGSGGYGGDSTLEDLQTILKDGPRKWPQLSYLGLRDSEYSDAIAIALTADGGLPLLHQIRTLDLSLGTLGDEGVRALAACPAIARLARLDIHHHYASEESVAALEALGIEIDASEAQGEASLDDRYVAVSE